MRSIFPFSLQLSFTNPQQSIRKWLSNFNITQPKTAHLLCRLIPARCPFERDIVFFNHTLFQIPPLCKLNPFYEQLIDLRFRALMFLADECGEDITEYCEN